MRLRPSALLPPLAALAALSLSGCTKPPPKGDPEALADYREANDPYEPTNRVFYAVNDKLDRAILRPAAVGYRAVVPPSVRPHVHSVLTNVANPVQFANDVLEGKPRRAGDTFMRFLVNSTLGIGGVFDVANGMGWPDHDNDMGLTLALWGVPSGPYLLLPVIGPSNPRDGVGYGLQTGLDPFTYVSFNGVNTLGWSRFGLGAVDQRSRVLKPLDAMNAGALDPYATLRTFYLQHRKSEIDAIRDDRRATVPDWYDVPKQAAAPAGSHPSPHDASPLNLGGAMHP